MFGRVVARKIVGLQNSANTSCAFEIDNIYLFHIVFFSFVYRLYKFRFEIIRIFESFLYDNLLLAIKIQFSLNGNPI